MKRDKPTEVSKLKKLGGLVRRLWASVNADRAVAVFTAVIVLLTILQWRIFAHQLEAMHVDQRAWLIVHRKSSAYTMNAGSLPFIELSVENTGKTSALSVDARFFIDVLGRDTKPDFSRDSGYSNAMAGAIPPGDPQPIPIFRLSPDSGGDKFNGIPLRPDEKDALDHDRAWVPVWGTVTYQDVFHAEHWLHFCVYPTDHRPDASVGQACSAYNDIDRNPD
jgi:hypothetical protein